MRNKDKILEDIETANAALSILTEALDDLTIEREAKFMEWKNTPRWRFIKKKRTWKKFLTTHETGDTVALMLCNTMTYILKLQLELGEANGTDS